MSETKRRSWDDCPYMYPRGNCHGCLNAGCCVYVVSGQGAELVSSRDRRSRADEGMGQELTSVAMPNDDEHETLRQMKNNVGPASILFDLAILCREHAEKYPMNDPGYWRSAADKLDQTAHWLVSR